MPIEEKDIGTKEIYDKSGNYLGNVTGRKEDIERFSNRDLANQLEVDRRRHKENLERRK